MTSFNSYKNDTSHFYFSVEGKGNPPPAPSRNSCGLFPNHSINKLDIRTLPLYEEDTLSKIKDVAQSLSSEDFKLRRVAHVPPRRGVSRPKMSRLDSDVEAPRSKTSPFAICKQRALTNNRLFQECAAAALNTLFGSRLEAVSSTKEILEVLLAKENLSDRTKESIISTLQKFVAMQTQDPECAGWALNELKTLAKDPDPSIQIKTIIALGTPIPSQHLPWVKDLLVNLSTTQRYSALDEIFLKIRKIGTQSLEEAKWAEEIFETVSRHDSSFLREMVALRMVQLSVAYHDLELMKRTRERLERLAQDPNNATRLKVLSIITESCIAFRKYIDWEATGTSLEVTETTVSEGSSKLKILAETTLLWTKALFERAVQDSKGPRSGLSSSIYPLGAMHPSLVGWAKGLLETLAHDQNKEVRNAAAFNLIELCTAYPQDQELLKRAKQELEKLSEDLDPSNLLRITLTFTKLRDIYPQDQELLEWIKQGLHKLSEDRDPSVLSHIASVFTDLDNIPKDPELAKWLKVKLESFLTLPTRTVAKFPYPGDIPFLSELIEVARAPDEPTQEGDFSAQTGNGTEILESFVMRALLTIGEAHLELKELAEKIFEETSRYLGLVHLENVASAIINYCLADPMDLERADFAIRMFERLLDLPVPFLQYRIFSAIGKLAIQYKNSRYLEWAKKKLEEGIEKATDFDTQTAIASAIGNIGALNLTEAGWAQKTLERWIFIREATEEPGKVGKVTSVKTSLYNIVALPIGTIGAAHSAFAVWAKELLERFPILEGNHYYGYYDSIISAFNELVAAHPEFVEPVKKLLESSAIHDFAHWQRAKTIITIGTVYPEQAEWAIKKLMVLALSPVVFRDDIIIKGFTHILKYYAMGEFFEEKFAHRV